MISMQSWGHQMQQIVYWPAILIGIDHIHWKHFQKLSFAVDFSHKNYTWFSFHVKMHTQIKPCYFKTSEMSSARGIFSVKIVQSSSSMSIIEICVKCIGLFLVSVCISIWIMQCVCTVQFVVMVTTGLYHIFPYKCIHCWCCAIEYCNCSVRFLCFIYRHLILFIDQSIVVFCFR